MVDYDKYMKKVLGQIMDSYNILTELTDKPGDLDIMKLELLKINGFFNVIINKVDEAQYKSDEFSELKSKIKHYSKNYYFQREIEIMAPLYSEDTNRLKNIRQKILQALNDKKLIAKIESIMNSI